VFWPETGDEVVVGFVNGDPRQAILLGALHGSVNTPPDAAGPPSKGNARRAIVSKGKSIISFDDDKKIVTVKTAGERTLVLDDAAGAITLSDKPGNTITLDAKGITLKSAANITIDAGGQVVIKGVKVDVQ